MHVNVCRPSIGATDMHYIYSQLDYRATGFDKTNLTITIHILRHYAGNKTTVGTDYCMIRSYTIYTQQFYIAHA